MIKPYGALKLVQQYISEKDLQEIVDTGKYPIITCDSFAVMECMRIADGSFTPIQGFFKKFELDTIIEKSQLGSGIFFPIPIYLQIKEPIENSSECILMKTEDGKVFGYIQHPEIYQYDLKRLSQFIFNTEDQNHPGVKRLFEKGDTFIGGDIKVINMENNSEHSCFSPEEMRNKILQKGWNSCVGFQTRNVPHLAHEYLQKNCMEIFDGVLIHPVIGWKKTGDYQPEVVLDAYKYLTEKIYPKQKTLLSGLKIQMRYAGPKEAVLHAIIRQNYGCTHFIVGRDHAGVGGYYGLYEAHEMVDLVQKYLDIKILKMKGPYYCKKCRQIVTDNICAHRESEKKEISGTIIRNKLLKGEYPPSEYIRPEIVDQILLHTSIFVE